MLIPTLAFCASGSPDISYQRYWEGVTVIKNMHSKWADACGQVLNFDRDGSTACDLTDEPFCLHIVKCGTQGSSSVAKLSNGGNQATDSNSLKASGSAGVASGAGRSGGDLADITQGFKAGKGGLSRFHGAGVMVGGTVWTTKVESDYEGPAQTLGDVLVSPGKVPDEFIVRSTDMLSDKGWVYLKGAKSEPRATGTSDSR